MTAFCEKIATAFAKYITSSKITNILNKTIRSGKNTSSFLSNPRVSPCPVLRV
jgi:hypothetical protein